MEYKVEKAEKSTVKISITLNHEEWEAAQEAAYNKTKGKYSLPGFRKGKVPMKMLENAYGKGIFYEDAINESFPKYYYEILEKEPSVEAVSAPDLDIGDFSEDGITYVATVAVKPEVKIGAYTGISFAKTEYNVKDEAVEAEIERLRERNSRTVDVTDRPAEDGDEVVIDYSGSVDGEKFEGGTAEKQPLTLGSHSFIPGFEEQVVGMKLDEGDEVIGMQMASQGEYMLVASEKGYGKRTRISEFKLQLRGGKGLLCYNVTEKTGNLVGMKLLDDGRDIMLITNEGILIRMGVDDISVIGRNTSGVKLMSIDADSNVRVASIAKDVEAPENPEDEEKETTEK